MCAVCVMCVFYNDRYRCEKWNGDTDIEIGGIEPQTGDFENKAQNTYKMIFWRSYMSALWGKVKKFPDIYEVILLKFSRNLKNYVCFEAKTCFCLYKCTAAPWGARICLGFRAKMPWKNLIFHICKSGVFWGHRRTGWFFSRSEVKPSDRRVSGITDL